MNFRSKDSSYNEGTIWYYLSSKQVDGFTSMGAQTGTINLQWWVLRVSSIVELLS